MGWKEERVGIGDHEPRLLPDSASHPPARPPSRTHTRALLLRMPNGIRTAPRAPRAAIPLIRCPSPPPSQSRLGPFRFVFPLASFASACAPLVSLGLV